MQARLDNLPPGSGLREFLATYQRTTAAVGKAILDGVFEDPAWVEEWDVAFARLYLDAFDSQVSGDGARCRRPWRLAFEAPAELPALRQVLLGINAHVNYDLPQALLAVISTRSSQTRRGSTSRERDHEAIDGVLSSRVAAEDAELSAVSRPQPARPAAPAAQPPGVPTVPEGSAGEGLAQHPRATAARLAGTEAYAARLAELEVLSAARIADLLAPGQVLLRLAVAGFGVVLPPPA